MQLLVNAGTPTPSPRTTVGSLLPIALVVAAATACHREPAVQTGGAQASTTERGGPGTPKYPVCRGQGGNAKQLAPAFLDKMDACAAADVAPASTLAARGGDGKIIEGKGDCQFAQGISCHFHTSMEFVTTDRLKDEAGKVGELHCIVPSGTANSPTVYGAHVRCKPGTTPATGTQACQRGLLEVLAQSRCESGWRCCDRGTLTKPVSKQGPAELALRPDFRICSDAAIEVDCGLFHGMRGYTANVAGVGEEFAGPFNAELQR